MPVNPNRQLGLPGFELQDYVNEAIDFLRRHEPLEGYFVGFSGGKDSITTLELCRMAGVKYRAFYSCTRIDPPEMYSFIKKNYPQVKWLYPKESFWKMIVRKSPPLRHMRWCCTELKKAPARSIPLTNRIMGIRSEESTRRASFPRVDKIKKSKQIIYKPIFHWPEWAVWEFIDGNNLPYPSLYDEGFTRTGCVCCPFLFGSSNNKVKRLEIYQKKWPALWKCFKLACKSWFDLKFSDGLLRHNQICLSFDEFWQRYIRGGLK